MRSLWVAAVAIVGSGLLLGRAGAAEDPAPVEPTARRIPVVGRVTFDGSAQRATVVWEYEVGGVRVAGTVPPGRMAITRLSSNVEKVGVIMPQEMFAIKIGSDLQRIFDEPIIMDTDQLTECTCRVRADCVAGTTFTCEIEGVLLESPPAAAK